MRKKLDKILATPIGIFLFAVAILIGRFLPDAWYFNFTEGLFLGLSIVLNLNHIISISRKPKKELN
jgi:hypothetical protein